MCCQQQISLLLHQKSIELGHTKRVNDVLILIKLLHDGDIMFELEIVISEGDWSDSGVVELTGVWIS